jgi:nucleotide-binding universal stress UspA family protein
VPVVLVGPHARTLPEEPIEEVIAFVDTSEMADRVVATAVDWAEALEARLWIVEVVEPDAGTGNEDVRDSNLVSGLARAHHRDGVDIEWDVLRSKDVPGEIARYLRDEHPKALPMLGSHGRSGWAELRLGSVSMRTAHEAPTPVVVVPVRPR